MIRTRSLALATLLVLGGCCSARDKDTSVSTASYKAAITKVRANLATFIRPAVADVMSNDASHSADWKKAKLGLIDDTIILCDDTLAGKNAGAPEAPK